MSDHYNALKSWAEPETDIGPICPALPGPSQLLGANSVKSRRSRGDEFVGRFPGRQKPQAGGWKENTALKHVGWVFGMLRAARLI